MNDMQNDINLDVLITISKEDYEILDKQLENVGDNSVCKEKLKKYVKVAFEEYKETLIGNITFSKISDLREYRLFLLIKDVLGFIPDEKTVSRLFQLTPSQAKSLLRAVNAKYKIKLKKILYETLKNIFNTEFKNVKDSESMYEFRCISPLLIDYLNEILSSKDSVAHGNLQLIKKKLNTTNSYEIANGSYKILKEEFSDVD